MSSNPIITTVVDVGARYGRHPSWDQFSGELHYIAVEPDSEEAQKLKAQYPERNYEVLETALGEVNASRTLYLTKHRGFSSFHQPDPENYYFKNVCPKESAIENTIEVKTERLDDIAHSKQLHIDFLKVDTEGSDLEVLRGSSACLHDTVIGLRVELHFQQCFKGQALFPEIFNYLRENHFTLVNLDYFGRGEPQHHLYSSPNPVLPDIQRYGVLFGADGVFIKPYEWLTKTWKEGDSLARSVFKWAWFALLNNAPDLALNGLQTFFNSHDSKDISIETRQSKLYKGLSRHCLGYLGKYRSRPESHEWALAQELSAKWFGINLKSGSGYWDQMRQLDQK